MDLLLVSELLPLLPVEDDEAEEFRSLLRTTSKQFCFSCVRLTLTTVVNGICNTGSSLFRVGSFLYKVRYESLSTMNRFCHKKDNKPSSL